MKTLNRVESDRDRDRATEFDVTVLWSITVRNAFRKTLVYFVVQDKELQDDTPREEDFKPRGQLLRRECDQQMYVESCAWCGVSECRSILTIISPTLAMPCGRHPRECQGSCPLRNARPLVVISDIDESGDEVSAVRLSDGGGGRSSQDMKRSAELLGA